MMPKTIIHLLSGGLDSVTMLYDLKQQGHNVHCLLFNYHQKHVQELTFAKLHCHRLGVLFTTMELPALGGLTDESWIVDNRNDIFLGLAVHVAVKSKADTVTIGCNASDSDYFPDCRKVFLDAKNATTKAAGYDVEICAPYLHRSKAWIGGMARELGVPASSVWSCYRGGANPCGVCPACEKLNDAMR